MDYHPATAGVLLARAPRLLSVWTEELPSPWLEACEKPGAWSVRDIVSHVADLEQYAWIPRVRAMLVDRAEVGSGVPATFGTLDRERFRVRFAGVPFADVLRRFRDARARNLVALDELTLDEVALARRGRHPDFGEVTVGQLLSTWVVHDLTHIGQIARTLAAQYSEAVGPWRAYLSILP